MSPNMQLLLVSVCLVICSSARISASDPHYVITVPSRVQSGGEEKACVTIQDLDSEFHLKLELQKGDHVQEIAKEDIKTDFNHCYTFQVPSVEHTNNDWSFHISGQGEHLKIDETRNVYITQGYSSCVIQTDKSTYKPGDIVNVRLMSIDHNLKPSNRKYEKILLTDPNGNHIGQWLDLSPDHGIVDLHYHLTKEPKLGSYKISISDRCERTFTVAEYVLKRFEVHINLPAVPLKAKSFNLEVCGSYTYGKSVQGYLDIEICKSEEPCLWYLDHCGHDDEDDDEHNSEKCIKITHVKTDSKGCLSREIDLHIFNFSEEQRHNLQIVSSLTEDGTGHTEEATAELVLMNHEKITFLDTGLLFQSGIPFTGKIKATDKDNQPMANTKVDIVNLESFDVKTLVTLETDKDGVAHFTLNTDSWTDEVALRAIFHQKADDKLWFWHGFSHDVLWLHSYYSESHSMLQLENKFGTNPCGSDMSLNVDYHISKDQLDSKTDHISFFYFTINEGGVHSNGENKLEITEQSSGSALHGSFPIKVHLDAKLAPHFIVLIYAILPKGETLGGISHYEVSNCFLNKVQLKFSEEKVHPGGKVNLEVSADAGSLCSVRSLDKGYLLQYPHDDTSFAEEMQRSFSRSFVHLRYNYHSENDVCPENQTAIFNRNVFDTSFLFKASNLNLITNTHVSQPVKCEEEGVAARTSVLKKKDRKAKEDDFKPHPPRSMFPDTWLFQLVTVGSDGHTVLNLTTPDTITKWKTDAVCMGNSGIGEIRNVDLVTFQPYFIDLVIPYSVVQGEKFKIDAKIFSYDTKCILVAVSLSNNDGIHTVQDKDQARCVCDGHVSHFSWDATASKLNEIKIHVESGSVQIDGDCKEDHHLVTKEHRVDAIEKTLIVKPRGYEDQTTETHLLYAADDPEKVVFTFKTPDRLVPGTERAHIIAVGDIMANVVVNLENILPLPDGCGEQSISKLSRYCYSLEYLQSANELTPETKEKFLEHMIESYQKQLTFKNEKEIGSYGLFSGDSPNLWVTALVVKAFNCIQQFIHIDEKHIQESIHWLESIQLPSGCFDTNIPYFSYSTCDDDDIKQTALVLISLLEHRFVHNGSIVENAISCMKTKAENAKSSDILAILAYVFTLTGDSELRALMLKRLDDQAETQGGSKHWPNTRYQHSDIETTSYIILARLSDKITTHKDLEESSSSVRWLASQQNPWGGFYSSQDTTLALQALAKYAKATVHKKGDSTVIIEGDSEFHKEIHIDKKNSLLVHTVDLPKVPGTYTASIKGDGCVYLQSHLHYNSLPDEHDDHFAVNVTTNPAICTRDAHKFEVQIDARYIGKRSKTNMALIKAELLSGFVPDSKSIRKLKKHSDVKRVDVLPGEIDIYLNELNHENEHFVFSVKQETRVDNLQPANVIVLDYYFPEVNSHTTYNAPCSKAHCNAPASERKDCGNPMITKEDCEQKGCCFDSSIPNTKWCFFHDTTIIDPVEDHHSHETQETQETH